VIFVFFVTGFVGFRCAEQTHYSGDVSVMIGSYDMTLKQAIEGNSFRVRPSSSGVFTILAGHSQDEIWVSVDGVEDTLRNAIFNDGQPYGLCGSLSTTGYTRAIQFGHYADEIYILSGGRMGTLQDAIDSGDFCCVDESEGVTCSGKCGSQTNNCGNSVSCSACPTCSDGIRNQGETGVDCGGPCSACPVPRSGGGGRSTPTPSPPSSDWGGGEGATCFPAGTLIDMGDGGQKVIEDVRIGDRVLSFDLINNEKVVTVVSEIEAPIREGLYTMIFEDGSVLRLTNEHPLYIKKQSGKIGWGSIVPGASEREGIYNLFTIEVGDFVFTNELGYKKIIDISYKHGDIQAYNLKNVELYHNFFADGFLAHNKKVICTEARDRGMVSEELYQADLDYAKKYANEATMVGYHAWAKPLVRVIRKNEELAKVILPLGVEWTKHSAYDMGVLKKDSEVGKVLVETGFPLCEELGNMMVEDGNGDYEFREADVERAVTRYLGEFSLEDSSQEEAKKELRISLSGFLEEAKEVYLRDRMGGYCSGTINGLICF